MRNVVIAIDGPAGAGKSSVAKIVAEKLGFLYVDTGAMYRALTLKALKIGMNLNDDKSLIKLAKETDILLTNNTNNSLEVFLDGENVTKDIRDPQVTNNVSYIANILDIRAIMVKKQRALRNQSSLVMEGRDITTVVFPKADKKFYLDASFDERLMRRFKQLKREGKEIPLQQLRKDIKSRDIKDKERKVGSLKKAKDAIYIDTTNLSITEVVEKILCYIK